MEIDIDLDIEDEELRLLADPSFQQFTSASPSGASSPGVSSPPVNNDEQSFLNNIVNQFSGVDSMLNDEKSASYSRRGPGRPRKELPALMFPSASKTGQKRRNTKDNIQIDRSVPLFIAPSSSENSNMCPEEKSCASTVESAYFPEKYPGKLCSLCNLGERSALGQGDLLRLEIYGDRTDAMLDDDEKEWVVEESAKNLSSDFTACRRQKNTNKSKPSNEFEKVGHAEAHTLRALLDGAYLYVHRMCAMWSLGISRNEDDSLPNIEYVVLKSLKCKCSFCGQYGASISCRMSCQKMFHLPCAAASNSFLIIESYTAFCSDHLNQVPLICNDINIDCRHCSGRGDISMLIMCSTCGDHYHTTCIGLANLPDSRSGWNCSQCSKCQICRQSDSTEGRSVKCEQCQKLYHATCLRPIVTSIPKYGWKCNRCRVCTDCGSRTPGAGTSSRWHCHYTICDSCYQQRNKGFSCPICHKAYRAAAHKEMVKCSGCNRFVHSSCDGEADLSVYHKKKENNPDYDYVCPRCKIVSNTEKSHLLGSQMRSSTEASENPFSSNLSQAEILYNDADVEYLEKGSSEYSSAEGKHFDMSRFSKKRLGLKEFQRSRGGKVMLQKTGLLSQFGRKRSGRGKSRHGLLVNNSIVAYIGDRSSNHSNDDDLAMEKKLLLCSAKDKFVLSQDICVMCGSLGMDREGCLIACAQCGQCYHPYCVNIKVSKVVLQKGWRCLDCTVCEGCGQKNDEARLILCDECDISYHIYCMNPPLDTVPHGNWKCKWCAVCQKCGRNSPGKNSAWRNGFLECGPCASQVTCCVCNKHYSDNELIIQCRNCERWLHCQCDSINNEEEAQFCDNMEYQCILCRPKNKKFSPTYSNSSSAFVSFDKPGSAMEFSGDLKAGSELNNSSTEITHWVDGVCVSDRGLSIIKGLTTEIKRKRKLRPTNDCNTKDSGILAAIESVIAASSSKNSKEEGAEGDMNQLLKKKDENYKDGMVWLGPENSPPEGFSISTNDEGVNILRKKRQRNLQKLGIGGFNVRNRALKKDTEGSCSVNTTDNNIALELEKKKKIVRKKLKSKLSEAYPTYLQEAFFGKTLLDMKQTNLSYESDSSDEFENANAALLYNSKNTLSGDQPAVISNILTSEQGENSTNIKLESDNPLTELNHNISTASRIVNVVENNSQVSDLNCLNTNSDQKEDFSNTNESGKKILNISKPSSSIFPAVKMSERNDNNVSVKVSDVVPETLTNILPARTDHPSPGVSSELTIRPSTLELSSTNMQIPNKTNMSVTMENTNALSKLSIIESQIFHNKMSTNIVFAPQTLHLNKPLQNIQQRSMHIQNQITLPMQAQHQSSSKLIDSAMPNKPINHEVHEMQSELLLKQQKSSHDPIENESKIYTTPTLAEEPMEGIVAGTQKTAEKMRRDEDLADMATISAVLYANTQHPELKQIYPIWNDRCKQILKRWRSLSTEKKAPFLLHAKDNRSALRMRRAQQDQEKICFQQKTLKEQEQERLWKQHQAKAKEAMTSIFSNEMKPCDDHFVPDGGTVEDKSGLFTSNVISDNMHQNITANMVPNTVKDTAMQRSNTILEKNNFLMEKNDSSHIMAETGNKQLRSLLQKEGAASSWMLDANAAAAQSRIYKQSETFKINMVQSQHQKSNTSQCNEMKLNQSVNTASRSNTVSNSMTQETIHIGVNKPDLKTRYYIKMAENSDVIPSSELEKLDQDENVGFVDILGGLGEGDDDDLLKSLTAEIGDDFNILEYADPELDELATSQNLLNKLDFDDNDKHA